MSTDRRGSKDAVRRDSRDSDKHSRREAPSRSSSGLVPARTESPDPYGAPRPQANTRVNSVPSGSMAPPERRPGKPSNQPGSARTRMGNEKSKESGGGGYGADDVAAQAEDYKQRKCDYLVGLGYDWLVSEGDKSVSKVSKGTAMLDPKLSKACLKRGSSTEEGRSVFAEMNQYGYGSDAKGAAALLAEKLAGSSRPSSKASSKASSKGSSSAASQRSVDVKRFQMSTSGGKLTGHQVICYYVLVNSGRPVNVGSDYRNSLLASVVRKMGKSSRVMPEIPESYGGTIEAAVQYVEQYGADWCGEVVYWWDQYVQETDGKTDTQLGSRADHITYR
ncbi:hypothetical protein B0H63DRAFT_546459 [Podospora didyma]|uniref:Uncharacterized protein n=1 Tax=Podospora didyma TaxID=330526 RepID=A0AAE0NHW0_9PEZI|nr:hypothetical protein B0H63DRAFT_546459 [Podospora didyma]